MTRQTTILVQARIPKALDDRLEILTQQMQHRQPMAGITKSSVIRMALDRGLLELSQDGVELH